MSAKLDKPLSRRSRTDHLIWKTVEMGGARYNIQVQIDIRRLEGVIAESIQAMPESHELIEGNTIVTITRAI